jgi:hypothetical protein
MATLPVGTDNVPKFLVLVQSSWRVIAIAITLRTSPRFAAADKKTVQGITAPILSISISASLRPVRKKAMP